MSVWLFLILSSPLALASITHMAKEISLKITETTTPDDYVYTVKVTTDKHERDKIRLQNLVDSLIKVKTIQKPSELTLKYFNGKTYNDTIERSWAIDLPRKLDYKKSIIDTLFYSENGNDIVAGLLINKAFNEYMDYPNGGIEYFGKGFEFDKDNWKPFKMLKYTVTGYDNYKKCSDRLRYYYLKKIGTYENEYNMNDTRFLNKTE